MEISVIDVLTLAPEDGKDGVSYSIVCSNTNPNVTDNAAVITLTAYKTTGSKREKITGMDDHLCFSMNGELSYDNPMTVTVAKGVTEAREIDLVGELLTQPLAVCTISPVVNGVNGDGVVAQYCPSKATFIPGAEPQPDETNLHDSFQTGDEWMRTKSTADYDWSGWFRVVGEGGTDGQYTDYRFNLSKDSTVASAYTCPGNLINTTWTDAPKVPTEDYPYLWMRMQKKNLPAGTAILAGQEYTYVRLTGENGKSISVQYSADASSWHYPFEDGDIWMKTSDGNIVRIVGEKGDGGPWTDYRFNISKNATSASATDAPADCRNASWQDAPMQTTDVYPYLWMQIQKYLGETTSNPDGNAHYVRITGEKGADGTSFKISGTAKGYFYDSGMYVVGATPKTVADHFSEIGYTPAEGDLCLYMNGVTGASIQKYSSGSWADSGATLTDNDCWLVDNDKETTCDGHLFCYLAAKSTSLYQITRSTWKDLGNFKGPKGDTGEQGRLGPMAYYAGEWDSAASYTRTEDIVPLVTHGDADFFWYPTETGTLTGSEPSDDNGKWKKVQKVPLLLAQLLMTDFGKIASAVFCGDFMLSQYGVHNGTAVNGDSGDTEKDSAFKDFEAAKPETGKFVPNLFMNFLTGYLYAVGAKFKGLTVKGASVEDLAVNGGSFEDVSVSGKINSPWTYAPGTGESLKSDNLIIDEDYIFAAGLTGTVADSGRVIRILNLTTGGVLVTLNDCKVKDKLNNEYTSVWAPRGRAITTLLGVGTEDKFSFWRIIDVQDMYPVYSHGGNVGVLAYGRVDVSYNSSSKAFVATASYTTFDNSTITVARTSTGKYTITLPSSWNPRVGYHVSLTPYQYEFGGTARNTRLVMIGVTSISGNVISVEAADDGTPNDCSFFFEVKPLGELV